MNANDIDPKAYAEVKEREYLRQKAAQEVREELRAEGLYDLFGEYPIDLLEPFSIDEILNLPKVEYLIDLYFVRGTLGLVASAAGAGKSFWMLDKACKLAEAGYRVLYLALEGLYSMQERVSAWLRVNQYCQNVKNNLMFNNIEWPGLDVKDDESVEWYRQMIDARGPFDLVVVDNLNRAGYDEEDTPGAAAVVRCLDALLKTEGVSKSNGTVVAVHNFGWYAKRIRGGSKLRDGVDTNIYLEVAQTAADSPYGLQVTRLWCDKMKRGVPFQDGWFGLSVVELDADTSSCVPIPAEKPKSAGNKHWTTLVEMTLVDKDRASEEAWVDAKTYANEIGVQPSTAGTKLNELVQQNLAVRKGAGGKKDPFKWQAVYVGKPE